MAEVADNDLWQRSVVGIAAVGNDRNFVNETLDKITSFTASMHGGQILIIDRALEIQAYPDGIQGDLGEVRTLAEAEEEGSDV